MTPEQKLDLVKTIVDAIDGRAEPVPLEVEPWAPDDERAIERMRAAQPPTPTEKACPFGPADDLLNARDAMRLAADDLDGRILAGITPRMGRAASLANATNHLLDAIAYLRGHHLLVAAARLAWCAALLDHAEGRPLAEALNDRWNQVRQDLPASIRGRMAERRWLVPIKALKGGLA